MARPRGVSDDDLLQAASDVLMARGPAAFTLERSATRAGVSAATLIKRFGSRRELLLALDRRWVASIPAGVAAAAVGRTAVDRLRAAVLWGREDLDTPEHTANSLAALALDLTDPALTELLGEGWRAIEAALVPLVQAAIDAGELAADVPAHRLARVLRATCEGSCLAWLTAPEGTLADRLAEDVDVLLRGWRTAGTIAQR